MLIPQPQYLVAPNMLSLVHVYEQHTHLHQGDRLQEHEGFSSSTSSYSISTSVRDESISNSIFLFDSFPILTLISVL